MSLSENFEEILLAFFKYEVSFMIAGGYAVNFHGYIRTTGDIDFWIKPVEENKEKILNALKAIGFPEEELKQINEIDFSKPFSFKIGDDPIDVDVFNFITGVKYEDAEKNMTSIPYSQKHTINYIGLHDLIVNKMLTNRTKDKLDVEELQKIQDQKK